MSADREKLLALIGSLKNEFAVQPDFRQRFARNPVKELHSRGLAVDEMIQLYNLEGHNSIIGQDC
jgi:hypothetical protein